MSKKLGIIGGAAVSALVMSSTFFTPAHAAEDVAEQKHNQVASDAAEQNGDQVDAKAPTTVPWPESQTTNRSTVATAETKLGTVKLRTGYYKGAKYGWAETRNSHDVRYVALDVDTDGDRIPNEMMLGDLRDTMNTGGYKTSSSSNRAFKACVKHNKNKKCHPSYSTAWW